MIKTKTFHAHWVKKDVNLKAHVKLTFGMCFLDGLMLNLTLNMPLCRRWEDSLALHN